MAGQRATGSATGRVRMPSRSSPRWNNALLRIEAATALREQGWSTPLHESDVETCTGPTHIFHYEGTGVPMVLLHGAVRRR